MALSQHERQVLLLNLGIEMIPDEAPPWTVRDFFDCVKQTYDSKVAATYVGDTVNEDGEVTGGGNPLSIADLRLGTDGTLTLLFHHGDKRAPDPALMHIPTRKVRTAGKGEDDGLAHGAHLVVSNSSGAPGSLTPALLERVPNLGRSMVIGFVNTMVRRVCQARGDSFVDPDNGKQYKCYPRLTLTLPASATVKDDLQHGRISRIEFVKHDIVDGLDEAGVIRPITMRLVHEVDGKVPVSEMLNLFRRSQVWGKEHGYQEMQIRYTRNGKPNSPRFSIEVADAEDAVYGRHEEINGFSENLLQCPEAVVDEVLTKMHTLFSKPSLWK